MAIDQPNPAMSEIAADARIAADKRDIGATIAKADHRMLAQDWRAAGAWYGAVGRLAGQGVAIIQGELLRARDAALWLDARYANMLLEGLNRVGLTRDERHPRFQQSLEIMLGRRTREPNYERFPQLPQTYYYPGTHYCQFADAADFAWREGLQDEAPAILAEAEALLADHATFTPYVDHTAERPQGDVHGLLGNRDWSTWELTDRGQPVPERVARAPRAHAALTAQMPLCRISSRAPSLMFSLLRPKSRIPAHTGMINTRLICHLPLIVPPGCGFRVGSETRHWEVGKLMVFDDTVEHEAWNDSTHDRLVLIFDVWRPEISEVEREQIAMLFRVVDQG
ncbi:MAG TPA: aspartyl/asparaginyl beta-hydroxylase domain-containing protein [Novosphingobium sp.]|nr:aspartyl/asparaginyl beta-hydroxylase domain-containing protein [Novosphingobium sp.]